MKNEESYDSQIILPYNLLAEKLVLGNILTIPEAFLVVREKLPIEAFYLKRHQTIYKGVLILYAQGKTIDYINLITWLQDSGFLKNIGGSQVLLDLLSQVDNSTNLEEYIGLIFEKYLRRSLIILGERVIEAGYLTELPLENIVNDLEQNFLQIRENKSKKNISTIESGLKYILQNIENGLKFSKPQGLRTTFFDLDIITQGFQNSELIIIAGRPSMGKTAFAFNIAKNISYHQDTSVIFFSLEMTREQLLYRLLASEVGITNNRLRSALIKKTEWIIIKQTIKNLSKLKLFIDDTSNLSVSEIKLKIKTINLEFSTKVGLVFIDYLQLLKGLYQNENRVQELTRITRDLKNLARDFNIPVIVLSQLSRNVESRVNKRPILSDLRESGCLYFGNFLFSEKKMYLLFSLNKKFLHKQMVTKIKFTGKKPTYKIETIGGYFLYLTGNHKILTPKGWKKVEHLSNNDFISLKLLVNLGKNYNSIIRKFWFTWDRIINISYNKILSVYDLQISKSSNFLTKNIFVHNSIEQDADMVIMLYRDEYYNRDTLNKSIIEIIISKHRNGPIGSTKLNFDSKHLRFFNI